MKACGPESRAAYVCVFHTTRIFLVRISVQSSIIGHEGTGMCPSRQWQGAGFEAEASGQCTEMKVGMDREMEAKRNREINKCKGNRND
jgi:hypothetical protein